MHLLQRWRPLIFNVQSYYLAFFFSDWTGFSETAKATNIWHKHWFQIATKRGNPHEKKHGKQDYVAFSNWARPAKSLTYVEHFPSAP